MFANFELYRGGWVDAETKRKHTRSLNGCLSCRKRKKRCDGRRPVCERCAKLNSPECQYPSSRKRPASSPSPESSGLEATPESIDLAQSPKSVQSALSTSIHASKAMFEQPSNSTFTSNLSSVLASTESLPSCSLSDLFLVFTPASHALDLGPESSIISLTIPLMDRSPAVFHAMIACSSIFLSQKHPSWRSIAIRHHCKTLRSLVLEMTEGNLCDPVAAASSLAVVMMLHLFEKFDSSSRTPSSTHVLAAQEIFFRVFSRRPPKSTLGTLALEAFVFRIAINSTFHPELLRTYTYLETLATLYMGSPALQHSGMESFRRALWLGLPPELFDIIYKIAFLQRKVPLASGQWFEAVALGRRLNELNLPKPPFGASNPQSEFEVAMYYIRRLYIAAAEIILVKIMHLKVKAADGSIQRMLRSALDEMVSFNTVTPLLMYPVAVLGTAAILDEDRELITSHLDRMRPISGDREVDSVVRFLQTAWGKVSEATEYHAARPDSMSLQLNIWLDDSRLRSVVL